MKKALSSQGILPTHLRWVGRCVLHVLFICCMCVHVLCTCTHCDGCSRDIHVPGGGGVHFLISLGIFSRALLRTDVSTRLHFDVLILIFKTASPWSKAAHFILCWCGCVYVKERERERESMEIFIQTHTFIHVHTSYYYIIMESRGVGGANTYMYISCD